MSVAVLVVVLSLVTVLVARSWAPLVNADRFAVDAANALVAPWPALAVVVTAVTDAGSPLSVDVLTAAAVLALLITRRPWPALYLAIVRLLELAAETTLKNVIGRPRPVPAVELATAAGFAFPSGHSAGTAALCVSLLLVARPLLGLQLRMITTAAAAVFTVGVATSRVLLGVHYPSDVIGGAVLGALCALLVAPLLRPIRLRV